MLSYANAVLFKWVRNFLLAVLGFLFIRLCLFTANLFFEMRYIDVWWYFLAFSIAFYYVAINGYSNSVISKMSFKTNWLSTKPQLFLPHQNNEHEEIIEGDFVEIEEAPKQEKPNEELLAWKEKILVSRENSLLALKR